MMRTKPRIQCVLSALVVSTFAAALAAPNLAAAGALSDKLDSAEKIVIDGLKTLKGESQAQVETELGAASEKATWEFAGQKYPVFWYKAPGRWTLGIFFYKERVIKTSFQVMQ